MNKSNGSHLAGISTLMNKQTVNQVMDIDQVEKRLLLGTNNIVKKEQNNNEIDKLAKELGLDLGGGLKMVLLDDEIKEPSIKSVKSKCSNCSHCSTRNRPTAFSFPFESNAAPIPTPIPTPTPTPKSAQTEDRRTATHLLCPPQHLLLAARGSEQPHQIWPCALIRALVGALIRSLKGSLIRSLIRFLIRSRIRALISRAIIAS